MRTAVITIAMVLGSAVAALGQTTTLWLRTEASGVSGYATLAPSRGSAAASGQTNSADNPAYPGVQVTATTGGTPLAWITCPTTGFTLGTTGIQSSGLWGVESEATTNAAFRITLHKYSGGVEGGDLTTGSNSTLTTELGTTTAKRSTTVGSTTSTVFAAGDRLVVKIWGDDPVGATMNVGHVFTLRYAGPTEEADGDSSITFNNDIVCQPTPTATPTISPTPPNTLTPSVTQTPTITPTPRPGCCDCGSSANCVAPTGEDCGACTFVPFAACVP